MDDLKIIQLCFDFFLNNFDRNISVTNVDIDACGGGGFVGVDELGFLLENLLGGPALEAELDGHIRQATHPHRSQASEGGAWTAVRNLRLGVDADRVFGAVTSSVSNHCVCSEYCSFLQQIYHFMEYQHNNIIYIFELFNGNDTAGYFQI